VDGQQLVARVEAALEDVEALPDPVARRAATAAVRAVLDLYGEGLARVVELVDRPRELAADELVGHLLLVHGLHPEPVRERVARALDEVRPYLQSHGGDVELLEVGEGTARVHLVGSCHGCPSSALTLRLAVEEAIARHAPDVEHVDAGEDAAPAPPAPALLQIQPLQVPGTAAVPTAAAGFAADGPRWTTLGALPELDDGRPVVRAVDGQAAVLLAVGEDRYAYRAACAACGASLGDAQLEEATLTCAACGHAFDARRAGRSLQDPGVHLDPLPLLVGEAGVVRVAVGA